MPSEHSPFVTFTTTGVVPACAVQVAAPSAAARPALAATCGAGTVSVIGPDSVTSVPLMSTRQNGSVPLALKSTLKGAAGSAAGGAGASAGGDAS